MNKLRVVFFVSFLILLSNFSYGQEKFTLKGNVKDGSTGEDLIGAKIRVKEIPSTGAISNVYGFYSLTLPEGTYTLSYFFVGFEPFEKTLVIDKDLTLDTELKVKSDVLTTVVVSAEKEDDNLTNTDVGVIKLSPKDIETVPVLFGEKDIIKVLQLTPGVKSAGEGNSGFYVRGGGADQNLILLDEAPVYNPSHLLGFFLCL